ncbi:hypothetical protein FHS31_000267 [Sphingomonas vulcanisoli]|uniref:Lipoprotein n=1 Tax=Sphingomonas vulcanisoli TaxID=1658060 RepID=A0ABX0TSB2_9SPHN|nr:hypothetical protein [Sphingomonas vulcanisoli]NIJ06685.1 hypothetical protein [Sphingomonas vulcanisoli]
MKRCAILSFSLLLAGCAVTPQVNYHLLSDRPRSDKWIPYQLTDTSIAIGIASDKTPVDLAPTTIQCKLGGRCRDENGSVRVGALGSPIPFSGAIFAIEPISRHFVETSITPSYFDNSLRLKSLDVEVRDHRLEAINTIGAIAVGAAKLAAGETQGTSTDALALNLPIVIDLKDVKAPPAPPTVPNNPDWTYSAEFLDDPAASGFLPRSARTSVHGAILTSACRTLRIDLVSGAFKVTVRTTVADPDWLVAVPLPNKGTVNFHPLCAADVQPGAHTVTTSDALAEATFKQIDALRAAVKKQ